MFLLIIAGCLLACYVISRCTDARLLRNGVFLTAGIVFGCAGLLLTAAETWTWALILFVLIMVSVPISVAVFGVLLIANGVTMLRREGRSIGNQLSLLAGVMVFALPTIAVLLVTWLGAVGTTVAMLLAFVSAYASAAFVSFAAYSIVYGRMRHKVVPAAIVVHGAGLRPDGTLTPLLRGRVDRALEVYRHELAQGRNPMLVPSGGQGDDEIRSEAAAMGEYLRDRGVPPGALLLEDRSTTTQENIARAHELLEAAGRFGSLLLVTSDYHVLRTASLARRLGVDAQVVGSQTARYYVPSAFLREFVALLVEHKWVSVIALGLFVLIAVAVGLGYGAHLLR